MKKLLLTIFSCSVLVLLSSCSEKKPSANVSTISTDSIGVCVLPIAYINIDSLLMEYEFAKDQNELLFHKQDDAKLNLSTKARTLENDMKDFQNKLEHQIYTPERAKSEQTRLMKLEQDLQMLSQKLTQEFLAEQQKVNGQLRDSLNQALAIYNAEKKFQLILSNTMNDNILYANKQYNITDDVLQLLNSRYTKKK